MVGMMLVGCTATKSFLGMDREKKTPSKTVTASASSTPRPEPLLQDQKAEEVIPETVEPVNPYRLDKSASMQAKIQAQQPVVTERPKMQFSATESANVRISQQSNNPFPGSGELQIAVGDLSKEFCYPYPGKLISSYGYRGRSFHSGVDIKAVPHDTIRAAWPGVVRMAKPYSGYGNIIVIRHYNGMESVYAHQSRNLVSVNDVVEAGAPIGLAGRTGRATTEHLHFEIRIAGEPINPTWVLDTENRCLKEANTLYCYNRGGQIRVSIKEQVGYMPTPENLASEESKATSSVLTASTAKSTSSATKKPTSSIASKQYHYVKSGETLSHIARRYSTTVPKLCALNGLKSTSVLQIKQKLRVK